MLRRNHVACSTAMVRHATCKPIMMPSIPQRQDHAYWLALLRDGSRTTIGISDPLVYYRVHKTSLSANKLVAAKYSWLLLRQIEQFSVLESMQYFSAYVIEAIRLRLPLRRDR